MANFNNLFLMIVYNVLFKNMLVCQPDNWLKYLIYRKYSADCPKLITSSKKILVEKILQNYLNFYIINIVSKGHFEILYAKKVIEVQRSWKSVFIEILVIYGFYANFCYKIIYYENLDKKVLHKIYVEPWISVLYNYDVKSSLLHYFL